jgi:hypothetical protein
MNHRYHYTLRPGDIGCQPDGHLECFSTLPKKEREISGGLSRMWTFGWVEYPEPLTKDQCFRYDLMPDDVEEQAEYRLWCIADRSDDEVAKYREMYREHEQDWNEITSSEWPTWVEICSFLEDIEYAAMSVDDNEQPPPACPECYSGKIHHVIARTGAMAWKCRDCGHLGDDYSFDKAGAELAEGKVNG